LESRSFPSRCEVVRPQKMKRLISACANWFNPKGDGRFIISGENRDHPSGHVRSMPITHPTGPPGTAADAPATVENIEALGRVASLLVFRKPLNFLRSAGLIRSILLAASLVLFIAGLGYLIHGAHGLFTQAGDYQMHWVEERYVFRGKNPADVFTRVQAELHGQPVPETGRDSTVDPDLGPVDGAYPLYAYFTAAFLTFPPTFNAGRIYYGALNLVAFASLLVGVFRFGGEVRPLYGLVLAASFFAVNSICTTFIVGQYGVLVFAALVAACLFDAKDRWAAAGLCLAFAMIKPSLAAPFVLPFLVTGRWRMLAVAGAYLVVASLLIWPVVKTSPLESLGQMSALAVHFGDDGYSLNNLLEKGGLAPLTSQRAAALLAVMATFILLWLWRASSIWTLFAIAAFGSRFWAYHRQYDNIVLVFLLVPLALVALRTQRPLALAACVLLGLTLWLPGRLTNETWWITIQVIVWLGSLAVFLYEEATVPLRSAGTAASATQSGEMGDR
jgi:hypothetical protein